MNNIRKFATIAILLLVTFGLSMQTGCSYSKVPAGHVGVKMYMLGADKGLDHEVVTPGRYWLGWNTDLMLFPTFTQQYVWTASSVEGSENNESITFQASSGATIVGDFGISYYLEKDKISDIFQKYRRGVDEITDTYLRNIVRDELNKQASKLDVTAIYGIGKADFMQSVQDSVALQVVDVGIIIEKLSVIGKFSLPKSVVDALNRKIEATQKAEQRENEIRTAEAEAKKALVVAEGQAAAILKVADAQAKANRLLSSSLTQKIIDREAIRKWNGILPTMTGSGAIPLVNLGTK
jgi:regulator of protease activity HflC (stomatin/prohibitin superfamily)